MDRLKDDFIASLPEQPRWLRCFLRLGFCASSVAQAWLVRKTGAASCSKTNPDLREGRSDPKAYHVPRGREARRPRCRAPLPSDVTLASPCPKTKSPPDGGPSSAS